MLRLLSVDSGYSFSIGGSRLSQFFDFGGRKRDFGNNAGLSGSKNCAASSAGYRGSRSCRDREYEVIFSFNFVVIVIVQCWHSNACEYCSYLSLFLLILFLKLKNSFLSLQKALFCINICNLDNFVLKVEIKCEHNLMALPPPQKIVRPDFRRWTSLTNFLFLERQCKLTLIAHIRSLEIAVLDGAFGKESSSKASYID